MSAPLSVLLVEDNVMVREMLSRAFEKAAKDLGAEIQLMEAERVSEAVDCLKTRAIDAVVLDLMLPDAAKLDAVHKLAAIPSPPPIVVVTAVEEITKADAIEAGAVDFFLKGNMSASAVAKTVVRLALQKRLADCKQMATDEITRMREIIGKIEAIQEPPSSVTPGKTK